jgi:RNA recognition motif-containing protein
MFKVPSDANKTLYVDGVPIDSNEREVAHIFRPFPGFENVKLIKKTSHSGREFYYCFVEFEDPVCATIA